MRAVVPREAGVVVDINFPVGSAATNVPAAVPSDEMIKLVVEANCPTSKAVVVAAFAVIPPLKVCNELHVFAVVVPKAIEIAGVAPPDETIGYVPVTEVTLPVPLTQVLFTAKQPALIFIPFINVDEAL